MSFSSAVWPRARTSAELGARIIELEAQAHELAGQPFNLGSPKQIGEIFFQKLQLPVVKKTPSGAPSTDEEVLQKLARNAGGRVAAVATTDRWQVEGANDRVQLAALGTEHNRRIVEGWMRAGVSIIDPATDRKSVV